MLDFLIIGGNKCASTSLADYVASSKNINFSKVKEPGYLHRQDFSTKIDFYKSFYDFESKGLKGEASVGNSDYRFVNNVIKNLKLIDAYPKIVLSVRNPVKRLESQYLQFYKARNINKKINPSDFFRTNLGIYTCGMFGHVVRDYANEFGSENILVIKFDDILTIDSKDLKKLNSFLNLGYTSNFNLPKKNISYKNTRDHFLYRIYKDHIAEYYRESYLPSLKPVKNLLDAVLPKKKIEQKDRYFLTNDEIHFVKSFYDTDDELFKDLTGFSYFELEK